MMMTGLSGKNRNNGLIASTQERQELTVSCLFNVNFVGFSISLDTQWFSLEIPPFNAVSVVQI